MSLNGILHIAESGVLTAQSRLRTVSDNVSNVATPGYIRRLADAQSRVTDGAGSGVAVAQLRLATDRFLQAAGLRAASAQASAQASAGVLDRAQALFGDPTGGSDLFASADAAFAAFAKLSADASPAARTAPLGALQALLGQAQGVGAGLKALSGEADEEIAGKVDAANTLLKEIDALNVEISRGSAAGRDVTGSQNQQSGLVDQLSQLIDVRVTPRSLGGIVVRASDGLPLAGDGAAVLRYDASGPTGQISVRTAGGTEQALGSRLTGGALAGLLSLRNTDLPAVADQLTNLTAGIVGSLNAAHNAHSAAPAPSSLTGRPTALSAAEAFGGFTSGRTEVALTDGSGAVTRRVDVDWAAGTLSVDGGAPSAFTPAAFASSLNTALGGLGSASFGADGALRIAATGGGGVSVADDPANPTSRAGRSFSGFLGLNDLVTSAAPSDYATGLKGADPSGFTGAVTLRLGDASGGRIQDITITAPAPPATLDDLVAALNSPATGAGLYGAFALDADGRLGFTPKPGAAATLEVVKDTTSRGAGGPSLSALFGVGATARAARLNGYAVRADIAADPSRLAVATLDTTAAVGAKALSAADISGADALGQAGKTRLAFPSADGLPGATLSVSDYAAKVSAATARRAADAQGAQTDAEAVAADATARRASVEGVNLDQELVDLTTYQQAYNASARMISAVRDLYDVLLNMVGT